MQTWKSMRKRINSFIITLLLFPCAALAQGTAPTWIDSDVRSLQYPPDTYYSGFSEVAVVRGEGQEKAIDRAKQSPPRIGSFTLYQRRIDKRGDSRHVSISGSDMEEQIRSKFSSMVKTASQTEVTGSQVETYYDISKRTVYAFAYVSRKQLRNYYQQQISLYLNKVESALQTAGELAEKGYKMRARKQCESVVDAFAVVAYSQDLLTAIDGKTAIEQVLRIKPHLILLEVMLSDMGGIEVCRQLRLLPDFKNVIISFLSARSEDYLQIAGLDGADDYISKPIKPEMLVAKVKSLLRRLPSAFDNSGEIKQKDILINKESYTVQSHGKTIILQRKEFELLYLLASKPNKVFRRNEIYDAIWGNKVIVGYRTIDVHIRRLRERTGLDNIKTVKGVGYKYEE